MKPEGQLHTGLWLTTWHNAFQPQVPEQGSMHFWLLQAWFLGQSELTTHSGLQLGGLPRNPGTQEHTAWPFIALHWLLGPQGDGLQGFTCTCSKFKNNVIFFYSQIFLKKQFFFINHTFDSFTGNESIASHSCWTRTHGYMIQNIANCVPTTSAWTWVHTLVLNTSSIQRTVIVENTFRTTTSVRITLIIR